MISMATDAERALVDKETLKRNEENWMRQIRGNDAEQSSATRCRKNAEIAERQIMKLKQQITTLKEAFDSQSIQINKLQDELDDKTQIIHHLGQQNEEYRLKLQTQNDRSGFCMNQDDTLSNSHQWELHDGNNNHREQYPVFFLFR